MRYQLSIHRLSPNEQFLAHPSSVSDVVQCESVTTPSTASTLGISKEQLWQATLGELELSLSKAHFTTWLRATAIASFEGQRVVIAVPNAFTKAWLESKYHPAIVSALKHNTGLPEVTVQYEVLLRRAGTTPAPRVEAASGPEKIALPKAGVPSGPAQTSVHEHYTFDSFVVGKGNELANATALAVAERPGLVYNPLFIYGGAGLGKTHLLQAIGQSVHQAFPSRKILYVPCERFTNEFIQAVSQGRGEQFKRTYRSVDLLLVDDVQFLAGRERTQEEFFHTFNALYAEKKQIVMTSDRPPKSIPTLEARLVSRFEWGMIADVAEPDLETRLAILRAKCVERGMQLSPATLQFIAERVQRNVRELEGALNRIVAWHTLNRLEPTEESVGDLLKELVKPIKQSGLTPKRIIETVAEHFGTPLDAIRGTSRRKEIVLPRQVAMFLLRSELGTPFPAIGQEFSGRDHTTAMHGVSKIESDLKRDDRLVENLETIRRRLTESTLR
jgi:chromosomal replication initiator protein